MHISRPGFVAWLARHGLCASSSVEEHEVSAPVQQDTTARCCQLVAVHQAVVDAPAGAHLQPQVDASGASGSGSGLAHLHETGSRSSPHLHDSAASHAIERGKAQCAEPKVANCSSRLPPPTSQREKPAHPPPDITFNAPLGSGGNATVWGGTWREQQVSCGRV